MRVTLLLLALLLLLPARALAHEIVHEIAVGDAAVVHLRYADGSPLAFEAYELYAAGEELPRQVGRTDAEGRVVFLPGGNADWRLKAWTEDGHGVDLQLRVEATGTATSRGRSLYERSGPLVVGLGLLLGLFGLLMLVQRRRVRP